MSAEHPAGQNSENEKLGACDLACVAWQTAAALLLCRAVNWLLT